MKIVMSYRWIKIQTHVHTINSDGLDTLRDMAYAAGKRSIEVIFLTDHNTMYGYKDIENISKETGVNIIKGIEYTTFYGHIISIGAPYFRWEELNDDSLNELADHIHRHNGIIGIAHPMAIGDPVCTGGRYKFRNTDFGKIDFIEEWHGVANNYNEWEKNKDFWQDKVNNGNIITTVYGGDFHKKEHFQESDAFNWVLIDETKEIETAVIDAISSGRVIMSKGPYFDMKIKIAGQVYNIGSMVELKENEKFNVDIDIGKMTIEDNMILYLTDNCGQKIEIDFYRKNIEICAKNDLSWIRAEILNKTTKEALAKSNPIYFKQI
jgi:hypothetical protein